MRWRTTIVAVFLVAVLSFAAGMVYHNRRSQAEAHHSPSVVPQSSQPATAQPANRRSRGSSGTRATRRDSLHGGTGLRPGG
jgi:anti-sigma-K factor RskA